MDIESERAQTARPATRPTKRGARKLLAGAVAGVTLAGAMLLGGALPANAAGACTSVSSVGSSPGYVGAVCTGNVKISWKCSSDLWGTVNTIPLSFGSGYSYQQFYACTSGYAHNIGWASN